jgi:hypothetical protein
VGELGWSFCFCSCSCSFTLGHIRAGGLSGYFQNIFRIFLEYFQNIFRIFSEYSLNISRGKKMFAG